MTVIGINEANCILMFEPKSNESVAKGMVNERAMSYTSDVGNLETSWRVGVSQTRTWESLSDQYVKIFPSGEYTGEVFQQICG